MSATSSSAAKRSAAETAGADDDAYQVLVGKRYCHAHMNAVDEHNAVDVDARLVIWDSTPSGILRSCVPIPSGTLCGATVCARCQKPFQPNSRVYMYGEYSKRSMQVVHPECSIIGSLDHQDRVYDVNTTSSAIPMCTAVLLFDHSDQKIYTKIGQKCSVCSVELKNMDTVLLSRHGVLHTKCGTRCAEANCDWIVADPAKDVVCHLHTYKCVGCNGIMTVPGHVMQYYNSWAHVQLHKGCTMPSDESYSEYMRMVALPCDDPSCRDKHPYVVRLLGNIRLSGKTQQCVWCCVHTKCDCCGDPMPAAGVFTPAIARCLDRYQFCANCSLLVNVRAMPCGCPPGDTAMCTKHFGPGWDAASVARKHKAGSCRVCGKLVRQAGKDDGRVDTPDNVVHYACETAANDEKK